MWQEWSPTSIGEKLKHVWEQMSNAIQRHHSYLVDIDKCWWIDRKYRGCCSCEDRRALHSSQKIPDKCLTCKNFKASRVAPPKRSWCLNIKGWAGSQRKPKPGKWSPHNSESQGMQCSAQETSAKPTSYQWWQCLPREAAKEGGREAEKWARWRILKWTQLQ